MDTLTRESAEQAFSIMGEYLRDRKVLGEIVVYGGSALMLQFDWRASTHDVDARISSESDHGNVQAASDEAARRLGLPRSWLNEAVTMYTSRNETSRHRHSVGMYPDYNRPGLRVLVAGPRYMLAMKIIAMRRQTPADRDFEDAVNLAIEIGLRTYQDIIEIYQEFYPDEPIPKMVDLRLRSLIERLPSLPGNMP